MGMAELITRVGDTNVEFQLLGANYFEARENTRDCKITFATTKGTALRMDSGEVIGLVLWLKKADVDRATSDQKSGIPALPPSTIHHPPSTPLA